MSDLCVCGHTADEHDVDVDGPGECASPSCPCMDFILDPESQTAPEVDWA